MSNSPTLDPKAAPGELAVVQDFINTLESGNEALDAPASLANWLAERHLLAKTERLTAADLRHAIEVREALRDLLATNSGQEPKHESTQMLSRLARGAQVLVHFDTDGNATLAPLSSGIDAALGKLIAIAARAMFEGTWQRLKTCGDQTCRWAFYDQSKNRSGNWCSMASCGNRSKARRYRSRAGTTRARSTRAASQR